MRDDESALDETGAAAPSSTEGLSFRVDPIDGRQRVVLRGEINENADFSDLTRSLAGDVDLDLEGIRRINSCGVREWVNFVRALEVRSLRFVRCSPVVVLQLNTIFNFRGRARVVSFFAPYVCESCHSDEYKLLVIDEHFADRTMRQHPQLPTFPCERCGGVMMFDELPERYLSFLTEEGS